VLCWHVLCCQVIRLRKKLSGAADAVRGLFGVAANQDEVVAKLEKMQVGRLMTNLQYMRKHVDNLLLAFLV
jgi:hypothetical protein